MAFSIRSLLGLSSRRIGQTLFRPTIIQGKRFLYTEQSLGLPPYEATRVSFQRQFTNVEDNFRTKMEQICEEESGMIFTEDLKAILHLARKDSDDLELIVKMIRKFHKQNQDLRFGNFVFGPVVMRTFYFLDAPDLALKVFNDDTLDNFFDQFITYQLLMCLLYNHQRYQDMIAVYDRIKDKYTAGTPFPRNAALLVFVACYKLNNAESLKYAINLWTQMCERKFEPHRRMAVTLAALAINQGSAAIALEVLSNIRTQRYIDCRCLKILASLNLSRFDDVIRIYASSTQRDESQTGRDCYFIDVIEKTEEVLNEQKPPQATEILRLINLLRVQGQVINTRLDDHLCTPIQRNPGVNPQRKMTSTDSEISKYYSQPRTLRPSLRDLV